MEEEGECELCVCFFIVFLLILKFLDVAINVPSQHVKLGENFFFLCLCIMDIGLLRTSAHTFRKQWQINGVLICRFKMSK